MATEGGRWARSHPLKKSAKQVRARPKATHRLTPPSGWFDSLGRMAQDFLERGVASVSLNGDPMIYDAGQFPWVKEVEAGWRNVRAVKPASGRCHSVLGKSRRHSATVPSFIHSMPCS